LPEGHHQSWPLGMRLEKQMQSESLEDLSTN
jgi:hypothetical protein